MLLRTHVIRGQRLGRQPAGRSLRAVQIVRAPGVFSVRVLASQGGDSIPSGADAGIDKKLLADFDALTDSMNALSADLTESLQGTSIYLIGLMGAGKSTCGRILAKALGYYFFDTDELIEKLTSRSIAQIFSEDGEDEFRTMETDVLKELAQYRNIVVATGGGVPTRRENWGYMQQGIVAWLDGEPELLARRVVKDGSEKRPLVASSDAGGDQSEYSKVVAKLHGLLDQRRDQYGFADLRISLVGEGQDASTGAPAAVVAFRLMDTLDKKVKADAAEREARKNFTIDTTTPLPGLKVMTEDQAKIKLASARESGQDVIEVKPDGTVAGEKAKKAPKEPGAPKTSKGFGKAA